MVRKKMSSRVANCFNQHVFIDCVVIYVAMYITLQYAIHAKHTKVRLSLTFSRVGGPLDCKFELSKVTLPFEL